MNRTRSPLPFMTVRTDDWIVSGSVPMYEHPDPYTLSVFRPSNHLDGGWGPDHSPARHDADGLVFDCAGDADWYCRTIGLTRPWRAETEGR